MSILIKGMDKVQFDEILRHARIGANNSMIGENLEIVEIPAERMTNKEWIDFLSEQFNVSRTSAKEMLHGMINCKKEDNFKRRFNP